MKKNTTVLIAFFFALSAQAQQDEIQSEEMLSNWVAVTAAPARPLRTPPPPATTPRTVAPATPAPRTPAATAPSKPAVGRFGKPVEATPLPKKTFKETNKKVNRFGKKQ
jgi:hypothetical protein